MRIVVLSFFVLLFLAPPEYAFSSQANPPEVMLSYSFSKPTEKLLKLIRKYPQRRQFKIYGVVACIYGGQVLYTNGVCPGD